MRLLLDTQVFFSLSLLYRQPIFRNSEQPMESRRCPLTRGRWLIWLSFHPFTAIRLIVC
jgi:hypothetical protein